MLFRSAILIVLAAGVIGLIARTPPELHTFELSKRGIKVGNTMHDYAEVLSFWVEEEGVERPLLLVDTTKFTAPNLIIPIEDIDPGEVRTFLRERIKEVPMKEPVAHKILEFFGL